MNLWGTPFIYSYLRRRDVPTLVWTRSRRKTCRAGHTHSRYTKNKKQRRNTMTRFGGNTFVNCSVPFAFNGRYFILATGNPPSFSVVLEHNGKPVFEIVNNNPCDNPLTDAVINATGIITVSDKVTGKFIYKFRPESDTSIVFGKIDDGEMIVKISDKRIQIGSNTFENNTVANCGAGIVVNGDSISMGAPIPASLRALFQK